MFAQGLTLATVLTAAYVSRNGHHFPDVEDAAKVGVSIVLLPVESVLIGLYSLGTTTIRGKTC